MKRHLSENVKSMLHWLPVSGKLILVMDDGSETLIDKPGDTVVMRGSMHAWRNPGPGWARWVSVLVDADPAVVNGERLADVWEA